MKIYSVVQISHNLHYQLPIIRHLGCFHLSCHHQKKKKATTLQCIFLLLNICIPPWLFPQDKVVVIELLAERSWYGFKTFDVFLSFLPRTGVPVICSQPGSSCFHLPSSILSVFNLGLLVGEEKVLLIWMYFVFRRGEYFCTFIYYIVFGSLFHIPYPFIFILINLQGLFAVCHTYYKYFGHFIVRLSNLLKYSCLTEFVKFYSVKYINRFSFMVFVFAHMLRKILHNEDQVIMHFFLFICLHLYLISIWIYFSVW